ncbi:MAG: PEGA domain-containing protein, partial [Desulfobacterales bacterium]|nr:PEGA domain-containing protein [Desulfobacterales bacterium]
MHLTDFFTISTVFATARELGKRCALVIGVEYAGVRELKWTVDDAVEVGWLLEKEFGFDVTCAITRYPKDKERKKRAEEIKALVGIKYTDKEGISNLIDALEEKSRSENDQVLVYFSGHGRAYGESGKVGYLIPSRGDWKRRTYTLINMRRFDDLAENLKARHALFVVDSCFSGIVGAFSTMDYQNPRAMQIRDVKRLMGSSARQILTAGETGQQASMDPGERMSAFSFYFKRALEVEAGYPRADFTEDGLVTVSELHLYLSEPLKKSWDQDPCFFNFTKNSGQFVFVPKGFETRPIKTPETTTSAPHSQTDMEKPGVSSVEEIATHKPAMEGAGYLYITADPAGVKALITTPGGKNYTEDCPVRWNNLQSGVYVASLSRPMYHPKEITVKVSVGVAKKHVKLKPNFGKLTVTSDPEGADIYLNGVLAGTTPLPEKNKKSGVYDLKVQSRRYHVYEKEEKISDEKLTKVHARLKPAFGTLEVKIKPGDAAGAKVLLDEENVGEAAWDKKRGAVFFRKELISGKYLLCLQNDWYAPVVNQEIVIRDGKTTKKSYGLKPIFGTVNLVSKPSGAIVYIDGRKIGTTPIKGVKQSTGSHKIKVDKDEFRWIPKIYTATLTSGDTLNLSANLERKTG